MSSDSLSESASNSTFSENRNNYKSFETEVDYLLVALEELDQKRENYYLEKIDNDPHLDERATEALKIVMNYFVRQYGKLVGVDKKSRKYLRFDDIDLNDFHEILKYNLPSPYKKIGFRIFRDMKRGKLLRALFVPHEEGQRTHEAELTNVKKIERRTIDRENKKYKLHDIGSLIKKKHFPSEGFPDDITDDNNIGDNDFHRKHLYSSLSLKTKEKDSILYPAAVWKDCFAYQCALNVERENIGEARIIKCNGEIKNTAFKNSLLVVEGEQLNMKQCEVTGGEIEIKGLLKTEEVFFHGTTIKLEQENENVHFEACDFSNAIIDDNSLLNLAKQSKKCFFSLSQIETLKKSSLKQLEDNNEYQNSQEVSNILESIFDVDEDSLAGSESEQILKSRKIDVVSDVSDLSRNKALNPEGGDLADVRRFRTAHLGIKRDIELNEENQNETYRQKVKQDLRILFPMLGSLEAGNLKNRIKLFSALMDIPQENSYPNNPDKIENFSPQRLLNFIKEGGETFCKALGLDKRILNLKINLDGLEKNIWREDRIIRGDSKPITDYEPSNYLVVKTSNGEFVRTNSSIKGKKLIPKKMKVDDEEGHLTIYSQLQIIKQQFKVLAKRLGWYTEYLNSLKNNYGYELPVYQEGSNQLVLKNFSHPNLPDILAERRQNGENVPDKPVPQDIVLLPGEKQIISITAPNTTGKTLTVAGILENVSQSQSAAPCVGKIEVGSEGMYDHILYMSTKDPDPGDPDSGMEFRGKVIKNFLDKIDALITNSSKKGTPLNILIGLDEIVKDATNPKAAATIEKNFIKHLMKKPGINPTILLVSHNTQVIKDLKTEFDNTRIFVPDKEQEHHFVPGEKPAISDPTGIFTRLELDFLLKDQE